MSRVVALVGVALFGLACSNDPGTTDAGPDGSMLCSGDTDCDDGVFCTGEERCIDSHCVSFRMACDMGRICDESGQRCLTSCSVASDADHDGAIAIECGGQDCDDGDPERFPGAIEICDFANRDEDCDPRTFGARDLDGDGYSDVQCCNGTNCGTDCDDSRSGAHPSAPEVCNLIDDDCDGAVDEGVLPDWLVDHDGDGFGSDASGPRIRSCERPEGYADLGGDCDDTIAAIHPGAVEICDPDGHDDDCNGRPDDVPGGCDCIDGASRACGAGGRCAGATQSCPMGHWLPCSIEPTVETCDGTDEDCNGTIDDGLRVPCYLDADHDGLARGDAVSSQQCRDATRPGECPVGYTPRVPSSRTERDCDDGDATLGVAVVCYADADHDTYGTGSAMEQCIAGTTCPIGLAPRASDCCDLDSRAHPAGTVQATPRTGCGGFDFDCDGSEEREWGTYTAMCSVRATSGVCTVPIIPGWSAGADPGCGNSANFVMSCSWSGSCVPNAQGPRIERCR